MLAFLLDNGIAYHVAHLVGILEHVLEDTYLPAEVRKYKHLGAVVLGGEVIVAYNELCADVDLVFDAGWGLIVVGQTVRSFAMITASSNFSHM